MQAFWRALPQQGLAAACLGGDSGVPFLEAVTMYLTAVGTAVMLKLAPVALPAGLTRRGIAGVPADVWVIAHQALV